MNFDITELLEIVGSITKGGAAKLLSGAK